MDISNVQLIDRKSGKCLGIRANGQPGAVSCADTDKNQRWNLNDAYHKFGHMYLNEAPIPGKKFALPMKSRGNATDLNEVLTFDQIDGTANYNPVFGQLRYDVNGNIKGMFLPNKNATNDYYQPCLNIQTDESISSGGSLSRAYDDDTSGNCATQWDILYECDPTTMGSMNPDGVECDRMTRKYKCKQNYYGKNCDFYDANAKNTEEAYLNFFNNCTDGLVKGYSNQTNCDRLHQTQSWLPSKTNGVWYNDNNFTLWDIKNTDDKTYARLADDYNKLTADHDLVLNTEYNDKNTVYTKNINDLTALKDSKTTNQTTRMNEKMPIYNDLTNQLTNITTDYNLYNSYLTDSTVSIPDNDEIIATRNNKNSIITSLNTDINGLNANKSTLQTNIDSLTTQHTASLAQINSLRSQLGLPPLTA